MGNAQRKKSADADCVCRLLPCHMNLTEYNKSTENCREHTRKAVELDKNRGRIQVKIAALQAQDKALQAKHQQQKQSTETKQQELRSKKEELNSQTEELNKLIESKTNEITKEIEQLQSQKDRLLDGEWDPVDDNQEIIDVRQQERFSTKEIAKLQTDIDDLKLEIRQIQDKKQQTNSTITQLEAQETKQNAELEKLQEKIQVCQSVSEDHREQIEQNQIPLTGSS